MIFKRKTVLFFSHGHLSVEWSDDIWLPTDVCVGLPVDPHSPATSLNNTSDEGFSSMCKKNYMKLHNMCILSTTII